VLWVACATHSTLKPVFCAPDDGWKYHPKHVEQFPDINKLCNFASCWIYTYIGILLGVHYILHISRIRVKLIKSLHEMHGGLWDGWGGGRSRFTIVGSMKIMKIRTWDGVY
jgi:hypothetical protein